jgi:hypothetical protein
MESKNNLTQHRQEIRTSLFGKCEVVSVSKRSPSLRVPIYFRFYLPRACRRTFRCTKVKRTFQRVHVSKFYWGTNMLNDAKTYQNSRIFSEQHSSEIWHRQYAVTSNISHAVNCFRRMKQTFWVCSVRCTQTLHFNFPGDKIPESPKEN